MEPLYLKLRGSVDVSGGDLILENVAAQECACAGRSLKESFSELTVFGGTDEVQFSLF